MPTDIDPGKGPHTTRKTRTTRGALHLSLLAGLVTASVIAVPSIGHAATGAVVRVNGNTISHIAGAGEANRVRFYRSGNKIMVKDEVPLTPGDGCDEVNATTVSCTSNGVGAIVALLGDGSDSIAIDIPMSSYVEGGPGADAYYGGTAPTASQVFYLGGEGTDWVSYELTAQPASVTLDHRNNDGRIGLDQDNIQPGVENVILNQGVATQGIPPVPTG
ncbi:hypothetical protein [Streptosporangium sp. NPDC023615]|uniref:hypothetical protein n=1 Tax=Streptosporangium sp. NPDC023615 TaxID=3154794 RepID=UPI00341F1287